MRGWAILIAALVPFAASAESTVIRIEAKRGTDAAQAAADRWSAHFPDVVTLPLGSGWTGVALGPMERDAAEARLRELKAAGTIPADSFIAPAAEAVTPVPSGDAASENAAADSTTATPDTAPADDSTPAADTPPQPAHFIRLQAVRERAEGDAALAEWRKSFPEAGLAQLPNGWFAVTLGPLTEDVAQDWLRAFKAAGKAPKDAFVATADKLGTVVTPGDAPDLPPAGDAQMPPIDQVQRALRWAGLYDGAIDGKDGPKTRDAIAAEIMTQRTAPDTATAMTRLIERRAAWRDSMGLTELRDDHTGLSVSAPMQKLVFDRTQRALSIYGPKDESGAALILFSQPGGQQQMLDIAGLVTALGWVPSPMRQVEQGSITLDGRNATHIGHAEARVRDGRAEGFVLIWPVEDQDNQPRVAAEISDSLTRFAPGATDALKDGAADTADTAAPGAVPMSDGQN